MNRVVSECDSVSEDMVVSNNESENEYFKDLLDIDVDSFATLNDQVESYQVMLSNVVTAFIIPNSNSPSTDIFDNNISVLEFEGGIIKL